MAQVFVSHSYDDVGTAGLVSGWLRAAGHRAFLDNDLKDGLQVGDAWRDRLYEEIYRSDALVCIVTKAFAASQWCTAEVGIAQAYGVRLLPVRAETDAAHPLVSPDIQWADLTGDTDEARAKQAERARVTLVEALRRLDATGGGMWSADRSPYPGLRAFDPGLARVFFGRKAETRRLAERLRASAIPPGDVGLLAVVGPSGCGKSSLVQAGLMPMFNADPAWLVLPPLLPAADPTAALARLLATAGRDRALGWSSAQIKATLTKPEELDGLVADLLTAAAARRLLIIVDQAEELFTRTSDVVREQFAALIQEVTAGPVRVVATLRSDYIDSLSQLAANSSLPVSTFLLSPLARDMLPQVITGPARQAGIDVDDELAACLVADTGGGEALPLLAFVLERLADEIGPGGALSARRYELLGGVHGALSGQADAALAAARAATGRTDADVLSGLLRLVTVDDTGQATRRRVDWADLPDQLRTELEEFVVRRLLAVDTDNNRTVLSVTHEHILTAWPPLATAVSQAAEGLRLRAAVENDANNWQHRGRPDNYLWEINRAAVATASLDPADITPTAQDFLHAARQHGRRRRLRAIAVLVVLLLLVTAGGLAALIQWRGAVARGKATERARLAAVAESLLARADATRDTDPRAALRFATAADSIATSVSSQSNLLGTLAATSHLRSTLLGHSGTVRSLAFAGDGKTLATGSDDRTVILWDIHDRAHPRPFGSPLHGHPVAVVSVAISRDGGLLATGSDDRTVILWDIHDRAHPRPLGRPLHGRTVAAVRSMAFTGPGTILAISSDDGTTILWDVNDPARPRPLGSFPHGRSGGVMSLASTADGSMLATGSDGMAILWDVRDPANPRRLGSAPHSQTGAAVSIAFAGDGSMLVTGGDDGVTVLWDIRDPAQPRRLGSAPHGQTGAAVSIAFAGDGSMLATGSGETTILWDVRDPAHPQSIGSPLRGHTGSIASAKFTWDGSILATGSGDGTVILWDVTDPTQPRRLGNPLRGHTTAVVSVAFTGDGTTLATGDDGGATILWDVRDPAHPRRLGAVLRGHTGSIWSVAITENGRTLATGSGDGTVILWDVTDPTQPRRLGSPLDGHVEGVWSVAITGNGRTLAAGSGDGTVILWDITDPTHPRRLGSPLRGHTKRLWSVAFTEDDQTLATGSGDGTVILWDVVDPTVARPLGQPLTGHADAVWSVAFTGDGSTLATGSTDGTAILWDVGGLLDVRRHAVDIACQRAGRGLSQEEWNRYIPDLPYRETCQ